MGFFQRLKDATIGFSGYAQLGRSRWAFGFMTLILLIAMAVGVARWTSDARFYGPLIAQELKNGPDWGLVDGDFHYDGAMPAYLAPNIIVDTTGQYQPNQLKDLRQGILITKDEYYLWNNGSLDAVPLDELPFNFTRDDLSRLVAQLHRYVPYFGLLAFLFQLGFKAIDAVILAAIGQWAVKVTPPGRPAPFEIAYRLALHAMTLPIIIQWIFGFSSLGPGFIIWWGVAVLYTVGGLRAFYKDAGGVPE